jgi:hypothetical protein
MGIILEGFRKTVLSGINAMTLPGSFIICLIIGTVFIALFISAGHILGIPEISDLLQRVRNKLFKKSHTSRSNG